MYCLADCLLLELETSVAVSTSSGGAVVTCRCSEYSVSFFELYWADSALAGFLVEFTGVQWI